MVKGLGILAGGIFIGAVGAEIARKTCPGALARLRSKAGELKNTAKEAFIEGYHGALRAQEASPSEA